MAVNPDLFEFDQGILTPEEYFDEMADKARFVYRGTDSQAYRTWSDYSLKKNSHCSYLARQNHSHPDGITFTSFRPETAVQYALKAFDRIEDLYPDSEHLPIMLAIILRDYRGKLSPGKEFLTALECEIEGPISGNSIHVVKLNPERSLADNVNLAKDKVVSLPY